MYLGRGSLLEPSVDDGCPALDQLRDEYARVGAHVGVVRAPRDAEPQPRRALGGEGTGNNGSIK